MVTGLFVAASGWVPAALEAAIPPACRRGIGRAPAPMIDGPEAVITLPEIPLPAGARHLLPAFSVLSQREWSARFELSVRAAGRWSDWVGAAPLGPAAFEPMPTETRGLAADVDVFLSSTPVVAVRLRLRLRAEDPAALLAAPWLVALSACDLAPGGPGAPPAGPVRLAVPAVSQMVAESSIRLRICSPASVAMVLGYWGAPVDVVGLAAEMFHPVLDRYGVWPAAVRAAARRGMAGYLLRFPDWASTAWCLARGIPIIASVGYARDELTGAAIPATTGHLLVLTGWEGDDILVNDPAAPTVDTVARRYRRRQLTRAWLERVGVGYVLFRPG